MISLIALFVALGGTAGAASVKRLTGADIRDGSLSGVDIGHESLKGKHLRNGSLTGLDLRDGSLGIQDFAPADLAKLKGEAGDRGPAGAKGDTGATGPAGSSATLETATSTGGGVTNYQNGNPIVAGTAAVAGYYLVIVTGTVTNTGASDDYLNCGFDVAGTISGAEGFQTTAGNPTTGSSITLASTNNPAQAVTFVCFGNGVTTFDVGSMQMKLIKLADR